jgi:hypothetical protein
VHHGTIEDAGSCLAQQFGHALGLRALLGR